MPASGFGQKAFHSPESGVVCSDILQDFGTKQVDQNPHDISMIWPRTVPEEIFGKLWETLEKLGKPRKTKENQSFPKFPKVSQSFPKFPKHSHVRSEPRCPPRRLCNPGTIGEVRSEIGFSRVRTAARLLMANNAPCAGTMLAFECHSPYMPSPGGSCAAKRHLRRSLKIDVEAKQEYAKPRRHAKLKGPTSYRTLWFSWRGGG